MNAIGQRHNGYYSADACDLSEFASLVSRKLESADVPHASEVLKNIPLYDMNALRPNLKDAAKRRALMAEWAHVLMHSCGAIVLKNAYESTDCIDAATREYDAIIEREKQSAGGGADHFAAAGSNDRIWNSLEKLCQAAPETFVHYFANPAIDAACEAWLGPNYQMTAQVNLVHPGGAAQLAHRDYHLGFQTADISATYPAHVHELSPALTLQGAVAHCDMPVESGTTKLLPFSQMYHPGYTAWRRDDFRAYFEDHCVQLPLEKGDALFFSPAIFHAAGANVSNDIHRMANLLQISSAFGIAMESIDRTQMCKTIYPCVLGLHQNGGLETEAVAAAISATAYGYSFPTSLDNDPPVGGLAPETQNALFHRALGENWSLTEFSEALDAQNHKRFG